MSANAQFIVKGGSRELTFQMADCGREFDVPFIVEPLNPNAIGEFVQTLIVRLKPGADLAAGKYFLSVNSANDDPAALTIFVKVGDEP